MDVILAECPLYIVRSSRITSKKFDTRVISGIESNERKDIYCHPYEDGTTQGTLAGERPASKILAKTYTYSTRGR